MAKIVLPSAREFLTPFQTGKGPCLQRQLLDIYQCFQVALTLSCAFNRSCTPFWDHNRYTLQMRNTMTASNLWSVTYIFIRSGRQVVGHLALYSHSVGTGRPNSNQSRFKILYSSILLTYRDAVRNKYAQTFVNIFLSLCSETQLLRMKGSFPNYNLAFTVL